MTRFLWVLWIAGLVVAHQAFGISGPKFDVALGATPFLAIANQMILKEK